MQNVAHQLAAPINAIKMNIESVKSDRIPFERRKLLLSSIYAQGTILAHLVKNFSLMSHLDKDHTLQSFTEQPEEVDLYRLCINFSNDFQPMGRTKNQTITVLEDEFRKLGNPKIKVVKNLFAQVIYNLLENATKYGDEDSHITIGIRRTDSRIHLLIKSTGNPITPVEAAKVFDRGIRGSNAKKLHPAGTGFGLFIARRIIDIHGGTIPALLPLFPPNADEDNSESILDRLELRGTLNRSGLMLHRPPVSSEWRKFVLAKLSAVS